MAEYDTLSESPTPQEETDAPPSPVAPQSQDGESSPLEGAGASAPPPSDSPDGDSQSPKAKNHAPLTPQEKKARELIEQAEKKVKSASTFFGNLFGGAAKLEDAAELYVRAANSFKMAKKYFDAGEAFRQAANIHLKLDVKHEAATVLADAGQVLKKEDPKEATKCYLAATEIYTEMGRFSLAARYHSTIGEICETIDVDESIQHYEQAADFYTGEDSTASANKCLLKVAHMCATRQQFDKAAGLFEQIGRDSMGSNLLKYAAKDYFFKAAVCRFCISADEAKKAVRGYVEIHPGFQGTRELKLIDDLLEAFDEGDADKFADIVKDYDSISRIDHWLTALLLHIKKMIHAIPDIN